MKKIVLTLILLMSITFADVNGLVVGLSKDAKGCAISTLSASEGMGTDYITNEQEICNFIKIGKVYDFTGSELIESFGTFYTVELYKVKISDEKINLETTFKDAVVDDITKTSSSCNITINQDYEGGVGLTSFDKNFCNTVKIGEKYNFKVKRTGYVGYEILQKSIINKNGKYFIIFSSIPLNKQNAANKSLNAYIKKGLNDVQLINTNEYPNFTNGYWAVVKGPYTLDEAKRIKKEIKYLIPKEKPYIKSGWKK